MKFGASILALAFSGAAAFAPAGVAKSETALFSTPVLAGTGASGTGAAVRGSVDELKGWIPPVR